MPVGADTGEGAPELKCELDDEEALLVATAAAMMITTTTTIKHATQIHTALLLLRPFNMNGRAQGQMQATAAVQAPPPALSPQPSSQSQPSGQLLEPPFQSIPWSSGAARGRRLALLRSRLARDLVGLKPTRNLRHASRPLVRYERRGHDRKRRKRNEAQNCYRRGKIDSRSKAVPCKATRAHRVNCRACSRLSLPVKIYTLF